MAVKDKLQKLIKMIDTQFIEEDEIAKTNILLVLNDKVLFNV